MEKKEIEEGKLCNLLRIKKHVCVMYGISFEDLEGKSRRRTLVIARKIFSSLARKNANASLREIGHSLGGRSGSCIFYYLVKISALERL